MIFNLASLKEENVVVTNTDFTDSVLSESPFSIEVKRLKRAEKIDTMSKAVDGEGNISNGEYSKALFIASIASVDGMIDENGTPLGLEDGIREIIWEYGSDELVEKIKAVIQSYNVTDDKKKEELENDVEPTQIG